jgi:Fe-coproporphyrin III synthase
MSFTGPAVRVLQMHPTKRCNQRSRYPDANPAERSEIDASLLAPFIRSAARLGYTTLDVAGGEPLLYPGLEQVLRVARRAGMTTTVATNGVALSSRTAAMLREAASQVNITLDGAPARHNRSRGQEGAFDQLEQALDVLRDAGVPFGLQYLLSDDSMVELEWAARFAAEQRATRLIIRVMDAAPHTASFSDSASDDAPLAGWFLAQRLRQLWGARLAVEIDVVDLTAIGNGAYAILDDATRLPLECLSYLVSPLVMESDGEVVPLRYGFDRRFSLGNIQHGSLEAMAARWFERQSERFTTLCRRALADAAKCPGTRYANPCTVVATAASGSSGPAPTRTRPKRLKRGSSTGPEAAVTAADEGHGRVAAE